MCGSVSLQNYFEFFSHLDQTNIAILLISICSISLLVVVKVFFDSHVQKKIRMPIPADLILVRHFISSFLRDNYCVPRNRAFILKGAPF